MLELLLFPSLFSYSAKVITAKKKVVFIRLFVQSGILLVVQGAATTGS